jgi:DNA-binding transcriptional regulator YiaG
MNQHMDTRAFSEALPAHDKARSTTLQSLAALLKEFSNDAPREEFTRIFVLSQKVLELDDSALARMFRVSRPTIGRWARGESAPHPIGRRPVFESFIDVARAKLKYHVDTAAA